MTQNVARNPWLTRLGNFLESLGRGVVKVVKAIGRLLLVLFLLILKAFRGFGLVIWRFLVGKRSLYWKESVRSSEFWSKTITSWGLYIFLIWIVEGLFYDEENQKFVHDYGTLFTRKFAYIYIKDKSTLTAQLKHHNPLSQWLGLAYVSVTTSGDKVEFEEENCGGATKVVDTVDDIRGDGQISPANRPSSLQSARWRLGTLLALITGVLMILWPIELIRQGSERVVLLFPIFIGLSWVISRLKITDQLRNRLGKRGFRIIAILYALITIAIIVVIAPANVFFAIQGSMAFANLVKLTFLSAALTFVLGR